MLVLGNFKKDLIKQDQPNFSFVENLSSIMLNDIITVFQNLNKNYSNFNEIAKILEYINQYNKISKLDLEYFASFEIFIEKVIQISKLIQITKRKEDLLKELEISMQISQYSDYKATSDLLAKLSDAIQSNKSKLKYIEEDYLKRKNQKNQLDERIKNFEQNIEELNQFRRNCFSQINKITRDMGTNLEDKNNKTLETLGIDIQLSNSEKIRALQRKAKEAQYEINQAKKNLLDTKEKMDGISSEYTQYEDDYQDILETIKKDELRIKELEKDIKKNSSISDENFENLSIRPTEIVRDELDKLTSELEHLIIPETYFSMENPLNIEKIMEEFKEFEAKLKKNEKNLKFDKEIKHVLEIIEIFNKFMKLSQEASRILNLFLNEINLRSYIHLCISNDLKNLLLKISFQRKNGEELNFENLTTPEKVYSIISFIISINILLNIKDIIFTNLSIPNKYNKSGSIFRTIRKLIPLFETIEKFTSYKLVFIISNLEMKKEIPNLKVVKIEEK